jgi:hypothetical protein
VNPYLFFAPACYMGTAMLTANLGAFAFGCWWLAEISA